MEVSIDKNKGLLWLGLAIAVFFIAKIPNIFTPLFHDELGVYGRALFYMLDNGPSMLPGDVDPEISRGHPLFFTFFVSSCTALLGGSYVAARLVILFLSIATLWGTYLLGKEIGGANIGIWSAIVLAFQPLFFAQSTLILPEVMLALFGVFTLLFYCRKQYGFYFIAASLLVLTKETGIVVLAGIGLHIWQQNKYKINLTLLINGVKWMAPFLSFVLFLFIQRYQNGWFFFPYHTELMSFSILNVIVRLLMGMVIVFLHQGRFLLTLALIIVLWRMPKEERKALFNQIYILIAVAIAMFVFSALNFFMKRYFVLLLPIYTIGGLIIIQHTYWKFKHLAWLFIITLPFQYNFLMFTDDENMGYTIVAKNMKESITELDKVSQGQAVKVFARFPEINALEEVRNGFTTNPNYTLTTTYDETVDYLLLSDNDHFVMDDGINNVTYEVDTSVDSIINNPDKMAASKFELLFESTYYFNNQRLYRTNN